MFAKRLARNFCVDVLWHYPGLFLEPVEYEQTVVNQANPSYVAPLLPTYVPKGYPQPATPNGFQTNHYGAFNSSLKWKGQQNNGTKGIGNGYGKAGFKGG